MKIDIVGYAEHSWTVPIPEHARIHGAVIHVTSGAGVITVSGSEFPVEAGHVVLYFPTEEHGYRPNPDERMTARVVRFAPGHDSQTKSLATQLAGRRHFSPTEESSAMLDLVARLSSNSLEHELRAAERLLEGLLELLAAPEHGVSAEPRLTAIDAAMEHLYACPDTTLSEAADRFGVSAEAIRTQFRRHFNDTPMHYFSAYHAKRVAVALLSTTDSLRLLAERFGYCDEYHLSRVFKRHMGLSPARYREIYAADRV